MTETSITTPSANAEAFDPYAHATDFRGSAIIAEELEKTSGRAETHLNEALTRLKNMRRIGRHPRYITYAKLITAAAKVWSHGLWPTRSTAWPAPTFLST